MRFFVATAFRREEGTPLLVQVSEEAYEDLLLGGRSEDEDISDVELRQHEKGGVFARVLLKSREHLDATKELMMHWENLT